MTPSGGVASGIAVSINGGLVRHPFLANSFQSARDMATINGGAGADVITLALIQLLLAPLIPATFLATLFMSLVTRSSSMAPTQLLLLLTGWVILKLKLPLLVPKLRLL